MQLVTNLNTYTDPRSIKYNSKINLDKLDLDLDLLSKLDLNT